jgi:predicted nucleic acid-binding protein
MLVVDASCLYEVVADTERAEAVRSRLAADTDHVAPHVVDVEVLNVIRMSRLRGLVDDTAAAQAVDDLAAWPGERFGHRSLLGRAWELRHNVRGWDAVYVALAEVLEADLLTLDRRLRIAPGPRCRIEVVDG